MKDENFELFGEWNSEAPDAFAALVARDTNGRILMQLRDDFDGVLARGEWDLFGGCIEDDETPLSCIKREIHEELGLKIKPADLKPVARMMTSSGKRAYFFEKQSPLIASEISLGEGAGFAFLNRHQIMDCTIASSVRDFVRGYALSTHDKGGQFR